MINKERLSIYNKYNGNIDAWARLGDASEKSLINDSIWFEIDNLHHDIEIINNGVVSNEYKQKVLDKVKKICDDEESLEFFNLRLSI